ncbi:MAG: hypothetical protein ABIR18_05270 [Chitinophagaceae bacterium]
MQKHILIAFFLLNITSVFAQPISARSIEDSVIGWMKVYNFKGIKESKKVDDKIYSAAQLSICDSFANWIQASYIPKGGLGDVKKTVSEKLGLYNQNTAGLPQSYGAYSKTYTELKYNTSMKMEPFTNSHLHWGIMTNQVIGSPTDALNTPTQYYFTLPSFVEQGYSEELDKVFDLSAHPVIQRYSTYFQRNSVTGNQKSVLLFKDKRSPFIKITKGEYLQVTEAAINRLYEKEKKKIYETEKNNQRGIDYFMKYLNDKNEKRIQCLKNNKEKYKNRVQETAEIFTTEPDAMLENYPDVFEGNGGSLKLPVYKIDPSIVMLCKKDQPQWVVVTWTASINDPIGKQLHDAVINNFNFEYVYNFFFDPEKVKGQAYKPLRSPVSKEAVVTTVASEASKKNTGDKNVHFFEDFSTTSIGKKPGGWRSSLATDGTSGIVVNPEGLEGNWAMLLGVEITPGQLKKPLPQNFTLSYDVVASQNFTWGAKGLTFQLSKETSPGNAESYLKLRVRPGFDGKDGEVVVEAKFSSPPGYLNASKWLVAPGFSNNKKNNRITVTIIKKEETLQLFIDKTKIAEYEKAIPAALLFNALLFSAHGNKGENEKYYISNIRITKE